MTKIKKAMLFAAGLGERLRPLTLKTPKPLLPIGSKSMIEYALAYLKRFGVEEVVVNTHYLPEKFKSHLGDGKRFNLTIHFSHEEALLGTGGGLKNAQSHFKNEEAFFTLNSDTLINCDLKELAAFHERQKLPVTVVVVPWQKGYTRLQAGGDKLLNVGSGDHLFAGLTVLTPEIFSALPDGPSNLITEGIVHLMGKVKGIAAFTHEGYWRDIGSKESYQAAQEEWASAHFARFS